MNELTREEVQKLFELHGTLTGEAAAKALPGDICTLWKKLAPYWPIVVKAARLIPVVGGTVADILDAIGKALDTFCKGK